MEAQLPFHTARLVIRPVADRDLPVLCTILGDAEVMKLALYERPLTAAEAFDFIDEAFAKTSGDVTRLGVVCTKGDDAVIGFAGLLPCKYFPGELEFGFVLAIAEQHKGYATEIGAKLINVGTRSLHQRRLLALCDPRNLASRRVLEKLGMHVIDEIDTPDRGRRTVFATGTTDRR